MLEDDHKTVGLLWTWQAYRYTPSDIPFSNLPSSS